MELNEFITLFADQFDNTDESEITPECNFKDLDEWSSLLVLSVIAMAKINFGKDVTGQQIRECDTVTDLYNLIAR